MGSIVGGIASIIGGSEASKDASNNLNTIQDLADPLNSYQSNLASMYNSYLTSPTLSTNANALNGTGTQLANLVANPDSVTQTGSYQAALNQGLQATNSGLSAQGLNGSGAQTLGLANYAGSQASNAYNTQVNQLSSLYGQNQSANSNYLSELLGGTTSNAGTAASALTSLLTNSNTNPSTGNTAVANGFASLFGGSSSSSSGSSSSSSGGGIGSLFSGISSWFGG